MYSIIKSRQLWLIGTLLGLMWAGTAQAIPAWARQYEKDCSSCHTAWPQLNQKGREFKENGYRMADEVGKTVEYDSFPVSAVFISRPYDKKDSESDAQSRMLHELELFMGGAIGDEFSAFVEVEYEDANDAALGDQIKPGMVAWNFSPAFNLQAVWGQMLFADPYGFLRGLQKLSRGQVGAIDSEYGGADGSFNTSRQNLSATGRLAKKFFYSVGLSGEADDVEGNDAQNAHVRVAYDFTDNFMVGGLLVDGDASSTNRSYTRYGVDSQIDVGNSRINLAYIQGTDDDCGASDCTGLATSEHDNDAYSAQWFYTFTTEGGRPTFVPLIRFDHTEANDGSDESDDFVVNLTYYLRENVKAYVEYWDHSGPTPEDDDSRITLQAYVGF
ncbi:MAG: hypothetical protein ACREVZ_05045 [Burkholderiales bacterium]